MKNRGDKIYWTNYVLNNVSDNWKKTVDSFGGHIKAHTLRFIIMIAILNIGSPSFDYG